MANISGADPARLPFADHVQRFVFSNCSPRGVERAKAPLGLHEAFNRAMILLQDVVQVMGPVDGGTDVAARLPFHCRNR